MSKKKQPPDTAWPPTGVRDLKPEVPVRNSADQVRFPTLRTALERGGPRNTPTPQISPAALTEPLVHAMLRRTRSRTVEYLCRAYLQFGGSAMSARDLEDLCAAINKSDLHHKKVVP